MRKYGDKENMSKKAEGKQVTEDLTMVQPSLTCVFQSVFDFFFLIHRANTYNSFPVELISMGKIV